MLCSRLNGRLRELSRLVHSRPGKIAACDRKSIKICFFHNYFNFSDMCGWMVMLAVPLARPSKCGGRLLAATFLQFHFHIYNVIYFIAIRNSIFFFQFNVQQQQHTESQHIVDEQQRKSSIEGWWWWWWFDLLINKMDVNKPSKLSSEISIKSTWQ